MNYYSYKWWLYARDDCRLNCENPTISLYVQYDEMSET